MLATEDPHDFVARMCEEKTAFLTKDEANRMVHIIRKHRREYMAAYRCQICDCFHLTKQKTQS